MWILIVAGISGYASIGFSQEFENADVCHAAEKAVEQRWGKDIATCIFDGRKK